MLLTNFTSIILLNFTIFFRHATDLANLPNKPVYQRSQTEASCVFNPSFFSNKKISVIKFFLINQKFFLKKKLGK